MLRQLGQPAEARPCLERALRIAEHQFGAADPRIAVYLYRLAEVERACDARKDAISLLERAIAIDEAYYGTEHAEVITDVRALAAALSEAGRASDAVPTLERILAAEVADNGELAQPLLPTLNLIWTVADATGLDLVAAPWADMPLVH